MARVAIIPILNGLFVGKSSFWLKIMSALPVSFGVKGDLH
jgi:hypothetical protein